MTKNIWIGIVVVIVIAVSYWLFKGGYSTNTTNTASTSTVSTDTISISGMAFSPSNITIKKGTAVTWTNNDSVSHTVTESDNQTGPSSSTVAPGGTYTFTYSAVGSFNYHCTIHQSMTGTVTVTE